MGISDQIAKIIEEMLAENGGELELQRNKLADRVGCVPSQINYVITSRFNTDRGYIVESRRGGGGYVRITKVRFDNTRQYLMHTFTAVGNAIDAATARALLVSLIERGILSEQTATLLFAPLTDNALSRCPAELRDALRADMLKTVILTIRNSIRE